MADIYLAALQQIEKSARNTISTYEIEGGRFTSLVKDMVGEPMSNNDYAKVLEMYYVRYGKKNNQRAQLYCLMQMERLDEAIRQKHLRSMYPRIHFEKEKDSQLEHFLDRKRKLYKELYEKVMIKWLFIFTIMASLLLVLMVLGIHLPFMISLIVCLLVWGLFIYFGHAYMVPLILQDRMEALWKHLDPLHSSFEKGMKMQAPKMFGQ